MQDSAARFIGSIRFRIRVGLRPRFDMCGICGWYFRTPPAFDRCVLDEMASMIVHRGPDDHGTIHDREDRLAIAHNRLSILDLSPAGHQPMRSADGSVVLAFNGELYNFKELRAELESLGYRFISTGDTEVVVNALAHWGTKALERFAGMFALAAWFTREGRLMLARDPMGMKPLYYVPHGTAGGLVFASEIKAFLSFPGFAAEIDSTALRQFLEFGYTFDQSRTSLKGVSKLPPGHLLEVRKDGAIVGPIAFFTPLAVGGYREDGRGLIEERLFETLSEVVAQHMVSDVPIGLLLSGGLDSSIIAALAARHTAITTISMGFADSGVDEREYARRVASHIGATHREVLIRHSEITDGLEDVAWYFDDLFADWGTVSTRLLYKRCRELGAKVVLVGEGADELFGGYPIFEAAMRARGPVQWQLFQLYQRYAGRRWGAQFWRFRATMLRYLSETAGDMFQAVRLFESRNQLPNNYVMKVDKASMSVSVEARAPYLDRRVAELAYSIPAEQLLGDGTNKLVLRRMAERYELLPRDITRRAKYGASIAASWIDESDEFRNYARSVILSRNGWVDRLRLRNAMTDFFEGRRLGYRFPSAISIFSNLAWRLLLLNLWSQKYLGT